MTNPEEQDRIIQGVAAELSDRFLVQETRGYDPQHPRLRIATFLHRETELRFNLLPGGTFRMGLSEEEEAVMGLLDTEGLVDVATMRPTREVHVHPFLITQLPILAGFAGRFVPEEHFAPLAELFDASDEMAMLEPEGIDLLIEACGFQLPSEAQWEYACRAGTQSLFYFPADLVSDCYKNLDKQRQLGTILALSFRPGEDFIGACNSFGLANLFAGERCADNYHMNYSGAPSDDQPWIDPDPGAHVVRGGGALSCPWQGCGEWVLCMSASRMSDDATSDMGTACRFVQRLDEW